MEIINEIVRSAWMQAILAIATVLSVVLAVYFYYQSQRTKRPLFATRSTSLSTPQMLGPNHLAISWNNAPLARVTVTRLALWNAGNATIRADDIPSTNKLRVEGINGASILSTTLIRSTVDGCEVHYDNSHTTGCAWIGISYLCPRDGLLVEIVHTGNDGTSVTVRGKVFDASDIRRSRYAISKNHRVESSYLRTLISEYLSPFTILCLVLFLTFLFFSYFVKYAQLRIIDNVDFSNIVSIFMQCYAILLVVPAIVTVWDTWKMKAESPPASLVPDDQ